MDDLNEMARLHSAGATVRHVSPFDSLPTYKNEKELTGDFINKWAIPYYMEIASYGNSKWVDAIKEIKNEITTDMCLSLLGDFNWRTRLVGSYFAAVKDYKELISIIGTHFLKSEVCCVGRIYALTLAFFNDDNCIQHLKRYLDHYLTKPSLYFDQKLVMEAVLFLDKENKTSNFNKYLDMWNALQQGRQQIEKRQAYEVGNILESKEELQTNEKKETFFSTEYFDEQIVILRHLSSP